MAARAAREVNIGAAGPKGDQPRGWLSRVERMRFCINRSVDREGPERYEENLHLPCEAVEYASIHELPSRGEPVEKVVVRVVGGPKRGLNRPSTPQNGVLGL